MAVQNVSDYKKDYIKQSLKSSLEVGAVYTAVNSLFLPKGTFSAMKDSVLGQDAFVKKAVAGKIKELSSSAGAETIEQQAKQLYPQVEAYGKAQIKNIGKIFLLLSTASMAIRMLFFHNMNKSEKNN